MSELENIARDIVRHEEKRQAEKIKLESEIKSLEEVLEHGISTGFVEEEVIYVYSPKTAHEMREKLEENYKQLNAQLTIPKSIADALDVGDLMFLAWTHGNDLLGKVSNEERNAECRSRNAIAKVYLAGKALGVDLVKVGEG